jgi:3-oxoadipate enol-lactonase
VELWFEVAGAGPDLVFVHAAIADSRMWQPQWTAFSDRHRVVRCDLRGFGRSGLEAGSFSHCNDVLAVLDRAGVESAVVVGASLGGRVAMEVALAAPERVSGLVLVAAGLPGHDWSPAVRAFSDTEDDAIARGDIDGAVDMNLAFWLDGPDRDRADVSADTRALVAAMQRRAIDLALPLLGQSNEALAVPDVARRLGDIVVPTLVVVGDADVPDMMQIARNLAATIPNAAIHVIADAAHLPSLEAPDTFNPLLGDFLASLDV